MTEYYHGFASMYGGWTGFYNHYYDTNPKMESKFGIPSVTKDKPLEMRKQPGMDKKEVIQPPTYTKTNFNILEGIKYENYN